VFLVVIGLWVWRRVSGGGKELGEIPNVVWGGDCSIDWGNRGFWGGSNESGRDLERSSKGKDIGMAMCPA